MLKGIKKTLIDIFDVVYKILYAYARWVLLFVVFIVCAQVIARDVLKSNIRWNQEVALLLTIWMAFIGIAIGVEKNLHIVVEVFYVWFPAPMKKAVDKINQILLVLVGIFFTVYGIKLVISTSNSILPVTRWPSSVMYLMVPISGVSIIFFVVLDLMGLKEYKYTTKTDKANEVAKSGEEETK